jgi:acetylornithine deacetylase/succinyl-diaminopimelate desuccinylase-like protein
MDFRLLPGQNSKIILEGLKKLVQSIGFDVLDGIEGHEDKVYVSLEVEEEGSASVWKDFENSEEVHNFKNIVENVYGKRSFFSIAPGSTDANFYRNNGYCEKTIHFGPGKASLMHALDEYVEINDFINSIKVYTLFAYKYLM